MTWVVSAVFTEPWQLCSYGTATGVLLSRSFGPTHDIKHMIADLQATRHTVSLVPVCSVVESDWMCWVVPAVESTVHGFFAVCTYEGKGQRCAESHAQPT